MPKPFTTAKRLRGHNGIIESNAWHFPGLLGNKRVFRLGLGTEVFYGDGANGYRAIEEECGTSSFTIE
jgi:hypothetical protein